MLEILLAFGGIWIALIFAVSSILSYHTITKCILMGFGVLFLFLQGGCCRWWMDFDRSLGGSGNCGTMITLSVVGSIVVMGLFIFSLTLVDAKKRQTRVDRPLIKNARGDDEKD